MDLPAEIATALKLALGHAWREDAIETRTLLLDAAVAVSLPEARASATRACTDPNATMREHAARALRALGTPQAACATPAVAKDASAAPSSAAPVATLAHPVRVTFDIDGAKLAVVFEPELSPRAASRFVALARAGFYKGVVVHRVVPGYVVQFGDPGADGYGGSGELLRCETSPVPFAPLDVGVALAGRDTGSSQIFVTLARSPKLDGEYARVGHAEGDWDAVAQGDVIDGVVVEE
jgi:cyclophilin family peptidyl-prolyl cis-trans isomerase